MDIIEDIKYNNHYGDFFTRVKFCGIIDVRENVRYNITERS